VVVEHRDFIFGVHVDHSKLQPTVVKSMELLTTTHERKGHGHVTWRNFN